MGKKSKSRKTTEELIEELRGFHHYESADRMAWLHTEYAKLQFQANLDSLPTREKRTGATAPVSDKRPHLTLTVGLPCSGKSTWADAERTVAPDRVRIVNRDDIRASIGTRFEDNDEPIVERIRDYQIDQLLIAGYHVICSDTNLSPRVRRRLTQIAKTRKATTSEQSFLDVSLHVCLRRNDARWALGNCKVPNSAIERMHQDFLKSLAP